MKAKAEPKNLTPEDRQTIAATIAATMQRFYCDPQNGAVRAVAEMVGAFDFSVHPPRQSRRINPYAVQRIATAFRSYLDCKESLDEAFGFRGTERGSRSAGAKYHQAKKQYDVVFDYAVAREEGASYDEAVEWAAAQNRTSVGTVKRFIKK